MKKTQIKRAASLARRESTGEPEAMNHVELCTAYLLQKIEAGEIGPDTRLGEPSLARKIGVDRSAVRAAFERLGASGILHRVPRSGTYLKEMEPQEVMAANQVRRQLEVLGVQLAAQHATKVETAQLVKAAKLLDELSRHYADGELSVWSTIRSLEIEFHTMIARFSHNPYLLSMMNRDSFLQICFPFLMVSNTLKREELREYLKGNIDHIEIAEAIGAGDGERAGALMAQHVEGAVILFNRCLKEHGPRLRKRTKE